MKHSLHAKLPATVWYQNTVLTLGHVYILEITTLQIHTWSSMAATRWLTLTLTTDQVQTHSSIGILVLVYYYNSIQLPGVI